MTRTRWIIFAVIALLVLGGLVYFSNRNQVDVSQVDENKVITEGAIADRTIGSNDSVTLIEYGDFQCPGCKSVAPGLKTLVGNYEDNITFIFRNFPLTNIHPNAIAAATAAEAAGQQGKFFEMHDILFQNQDSWKDASAENRTDVFRGYAEQLGLNIDEFNTALESSEVMEKIRRDQALARKSNASSTPTVILNGEMVDSSDFSQGTEELEKKLRDAIRSSGQELPKPVNAIEE